VRAPPARSPLLALLAGLCRGFGRVLVERSCRWANAARCAGRRGSNSLGRRTVRGCRPGVECQPRRARRSCRLAAFVGSGVEQHAHPQPATPLCRPVERAELSEKQPAERAVDDWRSRRGPSDAHFASSLLCDCPTNVERRASFSSRAHPARRARRSFSVRQRSAKLTSRPGGASGDSARHWAHARSRKPQLARLFGSPTSTAGGTRCATMPTRASWSCFPCPSSTEGSTAAL